MPFIGIGVGVGRQRFASGGGGGFDADYQAVLDYATTQGYTLPSSGQQALQNQLVLDLKDGGIWSKLDTFGVFATDGDSDFALIDWIRLSDYTAINSPTFTTDEGFQGNGTSSYIDLNYDTVTDWNNVSQNDACVFAYAFADIYPLNGAIVGSNVDYIFVNTRNPTSNMASRLNSPTLSTNATINGQGLTLLNRTSALSIDIYQRGSFVANPSQTSSLTTADIYVLRYSSFYYESRPSIVGYSSSLTSGEITDLTNYIDTYIAAI
jgi:hypothetical protein